MAQPLIPSPMRWVELWRRLLLLVRDWWWQLGITFVCGVGHVTAVIGLGVVSALIVGQVARGVDYTHNPDDVRDAHPAVCRIALSRILVGA